MSEVRRVDKPWGHEIIWAATPGYVGKLLHINQGHALSLQYHKVKDETVYVQSGKLLLELENDRGEMEALHLEAGQARHIRPGKRHRMTAETDVEILEASTDHLDDVVRLEDRYGRAGTSRA